jgi:hypothetical protein
MVQNEENGLVFGWPFENWNIFLDFNWLKQDGSQKCSSIWMVGSCINLPLENQTCSVSNVQCMDGLVSKSHPFPVMLKYSIHPKAGPVREVEWSSRTVFFPTFGRHFRHFGRHFVFSRPKAGPKYFFFG